MRKIKKIKVQICYLRIQLKSPVNRNVSYNIIIVCNVSSRREMNKYLKKPD